MTIGYLDKPPRHRTISSGSRQSGDPAPPKVAAVIVSYGDPQLALLAARTVIAQKGAFSLDVWVVVNPTDAADAGHRWLEAELPGCSVIRLDANVGFGGANNVVLEKYSEYDYFFLLNSDAWIEDSGAIARLLDEHQSFPAVGAVAPCIVFDKDVLRLYITASPTFLSRLSAGRDERIIGVAVREIRVDGEEVSLENDVLPVFGLAGVEADESGLFRWTLPVAEFEVAQANGWPPARGAGSRRLELVLEAPSAADRPCHVQLDVESVMAYREVLLPGQLSRVSFDVSLEHFRPVVNNAGSFILRGYRGMDAAFGQIERPMSRPVFAFCGAAVLLDSRAIADVGTFDESFFVYYEDTDLSWRMQNAGWSVRYTDDVTVRHLLSASVGEDSPIRSLYIGANRLRITAKYGVLSHLVKEWLRAVIGGFTTRFGAGTSLASMRVAMASLRGDVRYARRHRRYRGKFGA
jgi:GT2 family glycosyltransferase